ncbi:ABC transporter substrate-binding protein [Microbacterium arabinogalactanolyticum]|uniref:ABC transporter substrate-binding protein n=1 Tax=Microbacterium arabinogalactanolyticum TaxID=69365 RepID=UPI002553C0D5|nr:ABC transporter substrate-binding protein [Microbacterium arabinogalactanolyticum]GLC85489.1 iron ABC transporter substrate-binding protein [Microbacterium arabinogalactanolyticum]
MSVPRITSVVALGAAALLALAGCSSAPTGQEAKEKPAAAAKAQYPVTVTDMAGNEVTIESADSVVVTDNRLFRLVADWGIDLSAAPRALMSPENPLKADESILDLGTHAEPDFEKVVEADPDLIVNGYRYGGHAEDMKKAAPDAAFIDMTNDELSTDEYLVDSVELLGEVFGKQDEAKAVIDDLHAAVAAAKDAYDPDTTVMGLVTSGNEIRYSSPKDGRGSSIFFDLVGLTPALQSEGSTNDKGDDISIEAIAQSDADFFLVLDREAAFADSESSPALELINSSSALATVPAVQNKAIYVMPDDFYLTEDIVAYTTVLDGLTKAFSA